VRLNTRQEVQKTYVILAFMNETYTLLKESTLSIEEQLTHAYRLEIDLQKAHETIGELTEENKKLAEEVHRLQEQLKLSKHRQFGKKSEVGEDIVPENDVLITIPAHTRRKKTKGRLIDTSHLPRYQVFHDLSENQKICTCCQQTLTPMGEDVSEQIEILPQRLFVEEHIRYKYACRQCETVVMSPKEPAPIPKSMAGAGLLAEVIVNKYHYHLPLYRQSKIFATFHAIIPDNTLANWVMQTGTGLMPIYDAFWEVILSNHYLQVDETPITILNPNKKGYLWVYYAPHIGKGLVMFELALTRKGAVAEERLRSFKGALQTDGYGGYEKTRQREDIEAIGCLTHARRKFDEVLKITKNKEGIAALAIERLKPLYGLEAIMRKKGCSFERRKRLRLRIARPILEKFHAWLSEVQPTVLPKSQLGAAIQYTLNQWPYISQYVQNGMAEIDTNGVENKIRDIAVGRRNWLFMGNQDSGVVHALFYSLILSAITHQLNPRIYIHYLITQIHAIRRKEIDPKQLLPHTINHELLTTFAKEQLNKAKKLMDTS